ncbi:Di-copper centre-containing protein [Xylariaceae sp. FL0594]|nr:Di-copper centre-containing protein [Xylariaceae sp. FL0594]
MKTTQDTGTWDVSPSICIAPEPTYPIVGIPAGATAPAIPLRLEADSWYPGTTEEHLVQNSLFLYALKALQARDPRDKLSFFQIGGIHGMPFQPWDEDTTQKTPQEGYCTHDSLLFPCWHRPYVLLFEQALYQIMIEEIIPKLPGLLQSKWQSYAATWRLPYWDWALKKTRDGKTSPVYDIPLIAKEPRIGVYDLSDGTSVVYIDNPMYKFTMPGKAPMHEYGVLDVVDDPQDIPYERCVGTSRWAVYSPESTESSEDWIDGTVNNSMIAQAITDHDWYNNPSSIENVPLTEMVYRLFVRDYIDNYTQFATTKHKKSTDDNSDAPMAFLNLEFVHNNIHNWTGGTGSYIGHMTEVPVAGFDPIFFFHHCNVDRLFALWQAVNQNRPKKNWFDDPSEQLPDDGNWSLPEGTMDTPTTNLAPFHSDAVGTYYTPDKVRDWTTLGYSYPELQPWLEKYVNGAGNFDEDAYIADVQSQIEKLYSPGSSSSKALSLGFEHWTKDVIVNITYDRFAFAGVPYTIYFFIGNPDKFGDSNDASSPLTNHPQHVGYVYTFSNPVLPDPASGKAGCKNCLKKRASGSRSRAQVPITGALVARLRTGNGGGEAGQLPASIPPLSSLERGSVDEYLEKNLHWRVTSHNGTELPIPEHDPYIRVEVYHRDARFDDRANAAPYRRLKKATGTKLGGYRPGEPGH